MHPSQIAIKDYTYQLPAEKIALYPLPIRDQSRLLVYQHGNISEAIYHSLPELLPEETLLVFNQTKVVPARLIFFKPSGGKIEVFCLAPDERYADVPTAMQKKYEVYWQCLVGGAAKWKANQELLLSTSYLDEQGHQQLLELKARLQERASGHFILRISWSAEMSFAEVLHHAGHIPLPPYIHREDEAADATRYQTVFAQDEGSVAAPTAALHFTEELLQQLKAKSIATAFMTLHVGAGTFKPVKTETMKGHDMHAEWIDCSLEFIRQVYEQLRAGKAVVAVGTTSARTLESLYWIGYQLLQGARVEWMGIAVSQWFPYEQQPDVSTESALEALIDYLLHQQLDRLVTRTQIIIAPAYQYKLVKGLITNFHQPQSTLLLLVAAFIGEDWHKVYNYALAHDFRFLSYGDGCLLWKV